MTKKMPGLSSKNTVINIEGPETNMTRHQERSWRVGCNSSAYRLARRTPIALTTIGTTTINATQIHTRVQRRVDTDE